MASAPIGSIDYGGEVKLPTEAGADGRTELVDSSETPSQVSMQSMSTQGLEEFASEPRILPSFAYQEIRTGRLIGKGGFSTVHEVKSITLDEIYDIEEEMTELRKDFVNSLKQRPPGSTTTTNNDNNDSPTKYPTSFTSSTKYVFKALRKDLPEEDHIKGIMDLAIEANLLSLLYHPNIITLRGTANTNPHEDNYFVILDRLMFTLERKFSIWRSIIKKNSGYWMGPCIGYCCAKTPQLFETWVQRIEVIRDISNAIHYLHTNKIIYRDLKPDNIGFDHTDLLKLFDFGLAKKYDNDPDITKTKSGLYHLTGNTGSLRYMAPEVALGLPYNKTADAYSFGILFWQICSLVTPFAGFTTKMHAEQVVRGGHRPKIDTTWPQIWVNLMNDCWSHDIFSRPHFNYISSIMQQQLDNLHNDDGMLPTRTSEIRAAKRRKKRITGDENGADNKKTELDSDTRLQSTQQDYDGGPKLDDSHQSGTVKRFDQHLV